MTVAVALILVGALLLYCGVKGRSFSAAILGKGVAGGDGNLLGASS